MLFKYANICTLLVLVLSVVLHEIKCVPIPDNLSANVDYKQPIAPANVSPPERPPQPRSKPTEQAPFPEPYTPSKSSESPPVLPPQPKQKPPEPEPSPEPFMPSKSLAPAKESPPVLPPQPKQKPPEPEPSPPEPFRPSKSLAPAKGSSPVLPSQPKQKPQDPEPSPEPFTLPSSPPSAPGKESPPEQPAQPKLKPPPQEPSPPPPMTLPSPSAKLAAPFTIMSNNQGQAQASVLNSPNGIRTDVVVRTIRVLREVSDAVAGPTRRHMRGPSAVNLQEEYIFPSLSESESKVQAIHTLHQKGPQKKLSEYDSKAQLPYPHATLPTDLFNPLEKIKPDNSSVTSACPSLSDVLRGSQSFWTEIKEISGWSEGIGVTREKLILSLKALIYCLHEVISEISQMLYRVRSYYSLFKRPNANNLDSVGSISG